MKRSRFSEEQIIGLLKEHEAGVSVADLCRKHGVSDASIYKWKAKFGGMEVSEAKRLKTLADDGGLRLRMKAIAHDRRRFGYRLLHVLLMWESYRITHKKLFRLYREDK